jgi:hypothetical protein
MKRRPIALILVLLLGVTFVGASEAPSTVADRAAVERVYYNHRLGNKPPFEEVLPAKTIERMVRGEAKKEAALKRIYGVEIRAAQVAEEVKRMNSTTRAPETLAEIKAALGEDDERFARTVARPIVVERELRAHFENDDKVHAPQRRLAESAREAALAARKGGIEDQVVALRNAKAGTVNDIAWQRAPRPAASDSPAPGLQAPGLPTTVKAGSASYGIEASAQVAQALAAPPMPGKEAEKHYFDDMPVELQRVIRAQLTKPGDVSAVIETASAFLVFITRETNAETLRAASLSIPKRSYETWLAEQPETDR